MFKRSMLSFGVCSAVVLVTVICEISPLPASPDAPRWLRIGEPVSSFGEAMAEAFSSGPGSMVQTDSWSTVDNHGGLQVTTVYSNGTEIGYNVAGTTDCSQESFAQASGGWTANATAYGHCNSTVLLDQPLSNTGIGNVTKSEQISEFELN